MIRKNTIGRGAYRVFAILLLTASMSGVSAQTRLETEASQGSGGDSIDCPGSIAAYRSFYSAGELSRAVDIWRQVAVGCAASREDIYIDGEALYTDMFRTSEEQAYIDTVILILDQRTLYFGNKPSNELHKASLLSDLAGDDPYCIELAYNILRDVADSYPGQMDCSYYMMMATAAASLYVMEIIDPGELEAACVISIGAIDSYLDSNRGDSECAENLENLETYFSSCGVMKCSSIEKLYSHKVESNFRDTALVSKVFTMLRETGCSESDFYYNLAVKMFANDRSARNAVRLAELNVTRSNIEKAVSYFTEAYNRDTNRLVRSEVVTRVAAMELLQGKREEARSRAEHAWQLNDKNAAALLILADCYAGADLGNPFDNHSAYWVAVDYLRTAKEIDPSLTKIADEKIRAWSLLFPTKEECYYRKILDEGEMYRVGGWINEVTRIRFRRE